MTIAILRAKIHLVMDQSTLDSSTQDILKSKATVFSFSLRSMLVGIAIFAVLFGLFSHFYLAPILTERALFARVDKLGGKILRSDNYLFVELEGAPVDDDDISALVPLLKECPRLIYLGLKGTLITDRSIDDLETLPFEFHFSIILEDTDVTEAGQKRLGRANRN